MIFCNATDEEIRIIVEENSVALMAGEIFECSYTGEVKFILKHTYESSALPKKDIVRAESDDSVVSLLIASYQEPYFKVVLDSCCVAEVCENTRINILKEIVRPVYECSYDRLYVEVPDENLSEINYTFSERERFERYYNEAISENGEKTVSVIFTVLAVLALPLPILLLFVKWYIGLAATVLTGVLWLGARAVTLYICRSVWQMRRRSVAAIFDIEKIAGYFEK